MDALGRIFLSIIERLSSFGGKNVLPLYRLVHWKVSFIQRCLFYQRLHCTPSSMDPTVPIVSITETLFSMKGVLCVYIEVPTVQGVMDNGQQAVK